MLLKELRTKRRAAVRPLSRYQEHSQTAQVLDDGVWRDSWDADGTLMTKKADIETGEDLKVS